MDRNRSAIVGTLSRGEIVRLWNEGAHMAEIGRMAGVTRSRIQQVLHQEIPGLDGYKNVRWKPRPRNCTTCGQPFTPPQRSNMNMNCSTACFVESCRNRLNALSIASGARARQMLAYQLRVKKMIWSEIGQELQFHKNPVRAGHMATLAAHKHAKREGLPWPVKGVDGRRNK